MMNGKRSRGLGKGGWVKMKKEERRARVMRVSGEMRTDDGVLHKCVGTSHRRSGAAHI